MIRKDVNSFTSNSIGYNPIKDEVNLLNYKAFAIWVCGYEKNGKTFKTESVSKVCNAFKLYDKADKEPRKRNRSVLAINIETKEKLKFDDAKKVAEYFGYKVDSIRAYIDKPKKIKKVWKLSYLD